MKFWNLLPILAVTYLAAAVVTSAAEEEYEYYDDSIEDDDQYYESGEYELQASKKRVMYGVPAQAHDFLSVVNIATFDETYNNFTFICAASIVHPKWVVTEQACIDLMDRAGGIDYIRVRVYDFSSSSHGRLSESKQASFKVERKVLYPNFAEGRSDLNNVMLLQIKGNFGQETVAKVQSPRYDSERGEGVVFGWGRKGPGMPEMLLKKTGLIDWAGSCINDTYSGTALVEKAHKQLLCTDFSLVEAGQECMTAGGSPLVFLPDKILVGFISTVTCDAGSEKFMRVSVFVPWIEKVIGSKLQKLEQRNQVGSGAQASLKPSAFGAVVLQCFLVSLLMNSRKLFERLSVANKSL